MSGTVLDSVTRSAIAHALVSYGGAAFGFRFTDAGGAFRVDDVPCGNYSLNVSKPGYMSGKDSTPGFARAVNLGMPGVNETATSEQSVHRPEPTFLSVTIDPQSTPAQIPLVPLSSIAGTVLDENREPLTGASVQCVAVKTSLDGTEYVPFRTSRTDDRGAYSFLDLPPGDYVVRLAGEASSTRYFLGSKLNLNNDHRGLEAVYYPSANSPASASILHLEPSDRASADFRRLSVPAFDIDGHLTHISPGAWTQIELYREGDSLPVGAAVVNVSTGQFRVVDVPRGAYTLRAVQYQADPAQWLAAEVPVNVESLPIRNLQVELSAGIDIPVSVSYEAGAQPDTPLQIMLQPLHTRSNMRHLTVGKLQGFPQPGELPAVVAPPAPPSLTSVIPDKYRLTVLPPGGKDYVASATLGDQDVLHGEFLIGAGSGNKLQIVIRGDSATVEGQVSFQGQPARFAPVYLIPVSAGAGLTKFGNSNPDGSYRIEGVPPGDYRIQAWNAAPDASEIASTSGDRLTLHPGERRIQALEAARTSNPSNASGGLVR